MLQGEAGLPVPFYLILPQRSNIMTISSSHIRFGRRIQQLRKERKLTQEALAESIGVDRSYMGFVERGERNPTLDKIIKISKALKMSLSELFKSV